MTLEKNLNSIFARIYNQDIVINTLKSAIIKNKIVPAYIFSGTDAKIMKDVAILFFKALILNEDDRYEYHKKNIKEQGHPDLLIIEPKYLYQGKLISKEELQEKNNLPQILPQIRIEQIKIVKDFLGNKPIHANNGMVIINEVDLINEAASNALLKILEEPSNGIIILVSEDTEKLLKTITSRCQKITFQPIPINEMHKKLNELICIRNINIIPKDMKKIISLSNGSIEKLDDNLKKFELINQEIRSFLSNQSSDIVKTLSLAQEITDQLDKEMQIWLIKWYQLELWDKKKDIKNLKILERLLTQLKFSVQPRLAWEITLLKLVHSNYLI